MQQAIIVDIDGTLANIEHRRHFVERTLLECECGNCEWCVDILNNVLCAGCGKQAEYTKPDWLSFNKSMVMDTPNKWCVDILQSMCQESPYRNETALIFVTGREEEYRQITEKQIADWCDLYEYELFMRPNKDYRSDVEIKREIFETRIRNDYLVSFVLDDRRCCVELWRELGLVCLQCAEGDF